MYYANYVYNLFLSKSIFRALQPIVMYFGKSQHYAKASLNALCCIHVPLQLPPISFISPHQSPLPQL